MTQPTSILCAMKYSQVIGGHSASKQYQNMYIYENTIAQSYTDM